MALFRAGLPAVPVETTSTPIPQETTLARDYGGIALRLPDTDRYCYLHFGRELTHGHRNKLSINAYGKGGWYARNVMGGYGDNFKDFLETSASATSVMVDGGNADHDTGELLFHESLDGLELASAREIGAWKDVEHERTVVLTRGPLIVIDRCLADEEHTYDWLYHASLCGLAFVRSDDAGVAPERLGASKHYDSLHPTAHVRDKTLTHWRRDDGSGMLLAFTPGGRLYAMHVTDAVRPHDGLLWRKTGKTVGFAATFYPHVAGETPSIDIATVPVTDAHGKVVGLDAGQAVRVKSAEGIFTVLANYAGQPLRAAGHESARRVSVRWERGE
jgi:hypothetical protein